MTVIRAGSRRWYILNGFGTPVGEITRRPSGSFVLEAKGVIAPEHAGSFATFEAARDAAVLGALEWGVLVS